MTVASALTSLNQDIQNARTAITNKGGIVTSGGGSSQLATDISSIPSGGGEFIGIPREVKNGKYQMPTENFTFSLPSDVNDMGSHGLDSAFDGCTALTSVDLSALTTVSGIYGLFNAFYGCTALTSVDLSALTTVSGSNGLAFAFSGCKELASIDLSSLTTVSGDEGLRYAFQFCKGLTSVDLSSLTTVSGSNGLYQAFYNCTSLTSVDFPALTSIGAGCFSRTFDNCTSLTSVDLSALTIVGGTFNMAFNGCTALTDIYFRALTTSSFGTNKNQFNGMMQYTGSTVTHTLHFPSNLESTISALTGYPLFGGTDGYVVLAFDLPATN